MTYGVLGVGAIGAAIVRGLCEGDDAPRVLLSPRNSDLAADLAARFATVEVAPDNQAVVDGAEVVIVCLRTEHAEAVLAELDFPADRVAISAMASVPLDRLQRLVAPATEIARVVPLPSVAWRAGMTLVHPPHAAAVELFGRLGEAVEVADAEAFDTLIASTATVGLHFAYLSAITAWLQAHGIPESTATRYIAEMFAGLAEPTRSGESFETLAQERTTPGGLNEQFLKALEREGFLEDVRAGLDRILDGLKAT